MRHSPDRLARRGTSPRRGLRHSRLLRPLGLPGKLEGQTTVEYTLIIACVALPLSIVFVRWGQQFFAGVMSRIIKQFPWYGY